MSFRNNLESLRVLFTFVIVYFHMVKIHLAPLFPDLFNVAAQRIERAYLSVEFFFLLSGFLLFFSLQKADNFYFFIKKKFIRLWPVFAFSIGVSVIGFNSYDRYEIHILDLLFLQGSGLLQEQGTNFYAWYVSSLFIGIVTYSYFLKNYEAQTVRSYMVVLIYLSIYCIVHNVFESYTNCLLRAFSGIGIGYLLGGGTTTLAKKLPSYHAKLSIMTYSLIELALLASIINILIFHNSSCNYVSIVAQFSGLLWCFVTKKGFISNWLDKINFHIIGKYCYSIYIMQNLSFYISTPLVCSHENFVHHHCILAVLLAFVISIVLGIITYHTIEVPASKFLLSKPTYGQKTF